MRVEKESVGKGCKWRKSEERERGRVENECEWRRSASREERVEKECK